MKRFLSIFIIIMIVFNLVACDSGITSGENAVTDSNGDTVDNTPEKEPEEGDSSIGEIIKEETPPPREITVTDSEGREVKTSAANGDIVSVGREATGLLIALGAEGRLTGVEDTAKDSALFTKAYPKITEVPSVTDGETVLTDKIIEQKPGLVVLTEKNRDLVSVFEGAGITCAIVALGTVEAIEDSIRLMGSLSNTDEKANKLSLYYSAALNRIKVLTMTEEKQTVTVVDDDPLILELLSHLTCDITEGGNYVIGRQEKASAGIITVPEGIERWDEPGISIVLALYYYAHRVYPDVISEYEVSQRALNFYSDFYNLKVTSLDVGIDVREDVDK